LSGRLAAADHVDQLDVGTMKLEGWSQTDIRNPDHDAEVFERLPELATLCWCRAVPPQPERHATYSPLTSALRLTGPIDPRRAYSIINSYSLAFFDHHLKGQPAPLLDGARQFSEVSFESRRPQQH
jgi:hypothetical protein